MLKKFAVFGLRIKLQGAPKNVTTLIGCKKLILASTEFFLSDYVVN